jgi:3-hydroxyisobutyrate dehydrogenase
MDQFIINGVPKDLSSIEENCWQLLLTAALHYKHPLHNGIVANVNEKGVNMRAVVLRKVNVEKKQLAFHTDIRSGKWEELKVNPSISWLFYEANLRIQIRLFGTATLHYADAVADNAWSTSTANSKKIYMGEQGPTTQSDSPVSGLSEIFENRNPTDEESEAGRKNFGIVCTTTNRLEWLWLNSKGHRRAGFDYLPNGSIQANWLVP